MKQIRRKSCRLFLVSFVEIPVIISTVVIYCGVLYSFSRKAIVQTFQFSHSVPNTKRQHGTICGMFGNEKMAQDVN